MLIASEIMKIIAKRETLKKIKKKNKKTNKQRQKRATGTEAIMKGLELNDFAVYLS